MPYDVKVKIFKMTSDVDTAWSETPTRPKDADSKAEEPRAHGLGLSSLALVNKEFRDLAAKHQFEVISNCATGEQMGRQLRVVLQRISGRQVSPPIFWEEILPQYGPYITRFDLSGDNLVTLELQLAAMPRLTSLRALSFTGDAASALLKPTTAHPTLPARETDVIPFHRALMLDLVSATVTSLFLKGLTLSASDALIRRYPHLSTLSLSLPSQNNGIDVDGLTRLATTITALRHLTHLVIEAFRFGGWPSEALELLGRDPPPLKILTLEVNPLQDSALDLIGLFGDTLETLNFASGVSRPQVDLSSRDPLRLPHLRHLSIQGEDPHLYEILRLFTSSPKLSHLTLFDLLEEVDPANPILLSFLAKPDLIQVCLNEWTTKLFGLHAPSIKSLPSGKLVAYANLVRSRGLDPTVLDRPHLTPFSEKANLDYTEDEAEYLKEVLVRTLDFGKAELERMCAEGRGASAVEWVEWLKPLEKKRWAWKL